MLLYRLAFRTAPLAPSNAGLHDLIQQYVERSGRVLDPSLPYESRSKDCSRAAFDTGDSILMIAHCVYDPRTGDHEVTVASGVPGKSNEGPFVLTCAHTLEEIRRSRLLLDGGPIEGSSGSFLVSGMGESLCVRPVSSIVSAIPRSDILLMQSASGPVLPTLPISLYPPQRKTAIRAHFVTHERPEEDGWTSWVGGTWSKWVRGTVLGLCWSRD
ncbi:hypothetical protein C8R47DRAFT_16465 [Mycena vitilis]|nr:hypothetical protein C8R47DRAFT_16465 [Mycena vitilis]